MASFTVHLDSKYADLRYGLDSTIYHLPNPLALPSDRYVFRLVVKHASIPLSHWVIDEPNRALSLEFSSQTVQVALPLGNRAVDDLVDFLNARLIEGFVASYDEAINRLTFASEQPGARLRVGEGTTSGSLLGLAVGQESGADGRLTGSRAVDLAGTTSIFLRSNLQTSHRDPVSKAASNILAKIPVTNHFNEIQHYEGDEPFTCWDQSVSFIAVSVTDDAGRQLDLHGADYSLSLTVSLAPKESFEHARDYRISGLMDRYFDVVSPQPLDAAVGRRDGPRAGVREDRPAPGGDGR